MERSTTPIIAIVALIVAVIATVIAWIAYNRAGTDLEEQVARQLEQATQEAAGEAQVIAARLEARSDLLALRARLEADQNYDEAAEELREIESDLEAAYQGASDEAMRSFSGMRNEFDEAERALRAGSADSLEALGGLILLLGGDVREDEEE